MRLFNSVQKCAKKLPQKNIFLVMPVLLIFNVQLYIYSLCTMAFIIIFSNCGPDAKYTLHGFSFTVADD